MFAEYAPEHDPPKTQPLGSDVRMRKRKVKNVGVPRVGDPYQPRQHRKGVVSAEKPRPGRATLRNVTRRPRVCKRIPSSEALRNPKQKK